MRWSLAILATALAGCSSATNGSDVGGEGGDANGAGEGGSSAIVGTSSGGSATSGGMSTSGGAAGSAAHGGSAGQSAGGSSGRGGAAGSGGAPADGGKMGLGGIVGADASTGGPCGSIPAPGKWDAASISPVAAAPGIPGYQFKGKSVSVVVDPFDTAKVWLGTGEYGLFQSTDCGASWKHVSTGTNSGQIDKSTLWSMAVDPVNKGTIYTVAAYGAGSVWKSTNGGVDWVDLFPNQNQISVQLCQQHLDGRARSAASRDDVPRFVRRLFQWLPDRDLRRRKDVAEPRRVAQAVG